MTGCGFSIISSATVCFILRECCQREVLFMLPNLLLAATICFYVTKDVVCVKISMRVIY